MDLAAIQYKQMSDHGYGPFHNVWVKDTIVYFTSAVEQNKEFLTQLSQMSNFLDTYIISLCMQTQSYFSKTTRVKIIS